METTFYLVVARKGAQRITQQPPKLAPEEIAMQVHLELPNSLFERPLLQARVTLPAALTNPEPLSVEVQETVVASIQQATGLQVRLVVEPAAPESEAAATPGT
jgi:hypothetical protein